MKKTKHIMIGLALFSLAQAAWSQALVWDDDFDGTRLDSTKWEHCPEEPRKDNSFWCDEDAYLDGKGNLLVRIRKDEKDRIMCGAVRTVGKFERTYGYFEIRCKIPKVKGAWTAFWMMPYYGKIDDPGTHGTEIDIMESAQPQHGWVNHALHWGNYTDNHQVAEKHIKNMSEVYEGFHTYACHWTRDEYVFYIDGKETWRTSAGGVSQVPGYLKITAEAAMWAGNAQEEDLPSYMVVDYVRVYDARPMLGE